MFRFTTAPLITFFSWGRTSNTNVDVDIGTDVGLGDFILRPRFCRSPTEMSKAESIDNRVNNSINDALRLAVEGLGTAVQSRLALRDALIVLHRAGQPGRSSNTINADVYIAIGGMFRRFLTDWKLALEDFHFEATRIPATVYGVHDNMEVNKKFVRQDVYPRFRQILKLLLNGVYIRDSKKVLAGEASRLLEEADLKDSFWGRLSKDEQTELRSVINAVTGALDLFARVATTRVPKGQVWKDDEWMWDDRVGKYLQMAKDDDSWNPDHVYEDIKRFLSYAT
ncbi:hypothetical protein BJ508DRAFT_312085 [Ascobolus immersus RN42]|uniref:Uncharacterized protein n=1 Tax=Ascobolus immersus RN42 TaxID=1160509 RepID=A0A3N4HPT8_ASCIM|nr:hypothetical protein BJ508DRAFT_312085 [Ascobolus immersus RN42]